MFKINHPSYKLADSLQFRLRLLRYSVLVTRRLISTSTNVPISALQSLKARNSARSKEWLSHQEGDSAKLFRRMQKRFAKLPGTSPPSSTELRRNRVDILRHHYAKTTSTMESDAIERDIDERITLRDTLGEFMAITALMATRLDETSVEEEWMEMAAEYMVQAVLESALVIGNLDEKLIEECFTWGPFKAEKCCSSDDLMVSSLFAGEASSGSRVELWSRIRAEAVELVSLPSPVLETNMSNYSCLLITNKYRSSPFTRQISRLLLRRLHKTVLLRNLRLSFSAFSTLCLRH
jgi:hypothetical protein